MSTDTLDLPPLRDDLFTTDPFTLIGSECTSGHVSFPARDFCPRCYSVDVHTVNLPREGTIETFTTVRQAPPSFAVPYHLAFIRLDGPVVLLARLQFPSEHSPQIGQHVRLAAAETEIDGQPHLSFAFVPKEQS
ncbi:hypothetical protein G352_22181 [Rhodococcus ruber BKS 20-38]|uniref:DUF35 domain-containing protein n=1 Tax=Rhodococcus ruber BKS 20-38 TaxID=1278076 RepID=M2Z5S7_9NOCA|nr:OB-fold domain-containing protein [Rhodococcus ruber]EME56243.1 hypothetical protein G352_22181 [Rhodococcus ruber BKS 20-38]